MEPHVSGGGAVEADHPVVADERALGIGEAEAGVHLGAEAERDRPVALLKGEHRNVLAQGDLGLTFVAEAAVAVPGGQDSAYQAVYPRRGLGQLEAGDLGEQSLLRLEARRPPKQERERERDARARATA